MFGTALLLVTPAVAGSPYQVTIDAGPATVTEGGSTSFSVYTNTGVEAGKTVSVNYSITAGTAGTSDYTDASGTLTITGPDAVALGPTIATTDDSTDESDETFTIVLSSPTTTDTEGAALGSPSSMSVTITDNDDASSGGGGGGGGGGGSGGGGGGTPAGSGTLQFSASTYSVSENHPPAQLTINRTGSTSGQIGVSYATTNGTATAGSDYGSKNTTVQFANGVSSATIPIPVFNDAATEGNETFTVTLSAPSGGGTLGATKAASVTIVDDETAASPSPTPTATTTTEPADPVTYTRTLGLTLKKHLRATGTLSVDGGPAECIATIEVKIQKKKAGGGWRTLKTDATNGLGVFRASLPDKKGTYRAKVAKLTVDDLNLCGGATSAKKKHRH
jgi:hypothetical protein